MAVFDNMNYTHSPGVAPSVQEYFDETLQRNLQPNLVHAKDAQKVPLPKHNGKFVRFRKPVKLKPITTPLSEGVTPAGQKIEMTDFRTMVKPYGGFIPLTDEIDLYLLDSMTKMAADILADQARESLDTILRDAYNAGSNVFYPGTVTSRAALTATDVLDAATLKKVARMMERNSVPKFSDGFYHSIISPETKFDLTADPFWMDVAKYQDTANMEKYEIGRMLSFKFYETPNAKTFEAAQYLFGTVASLTASAVNAAEKTMMITSGHAAITPDVARELAGMLVDVKATSGGSTQESVCIERVEPSNGTHAIVHLRWWPKDVTLAASSVIIPTGGGAGGLKVHSTLAYGADAFGTVALGGSGDNVRSILKPAGTGGPEDPVDQRGTVAWKAAGFCGVILDDIRLCRIEHAVSG